MFLAVGRVGRIKVTQLLHAAAKPQCAITSCTSTRYMAGQVMWIHASKQLRHSLVLPTSQPAPQLLPAALRSCTRHVLPSTLTRNPFGRIICASMSSDAAGAQDSAAVQLDMTGIEVPPVPGLHDEVGEYCIVNFYHLVDIAEPQKVVEEHRKYLQGKEIRGRIWISSQGINAQMGGLTSDAKEYTEWIAQQPHFQGLRYSIWAATGHMFPKLRLKYKPNLISLAGGMTTLPVTNPEARATPLQPADWRRMISEAQVINKAVEQGEEDKAKKVVILDIRNDYEWDAGHFEGANRPEEEEFAETPVGEDEAAVPSPLQGADPDTPVMMYCTGGIRCDIYSTFLRSKGFNKLYTLEGGIQNYLKEEGPDHWRGSLFVFDGRMALPAGNESGGSAAQQGPLPAAVPCQLCGSSEAQLPHVNCANVDCNELFIACTTCKTQLQGCCCQECVSAPRLLRPIQLNGGHYGAWGNYVDPDMHHPVMARGRSGEGRVARRRKRREAAQAKREKMVAERAERKQLMKEAMARAAELEATREQLQQLQSS